MAFESRILDPLDPNSTLEYTVDWTDWLDGDEITTSQWIVPAGIVKVSESNTPTKGIVFLTGGVDGRRYTLTNRITTVDGRTEDHSIEVLVSEK